MLKMLIELANDLDKKGMKREANKADLCIKTAKQSLYERAVNDMSPDDIATMAEKMPPEKIKAVIRNMDPKKRNEIISDLARDPEIQATVLRTIETSTIKAAVSNMPPDKKREVVLDLAQDQEFQKMMLETLGLPPSLSDLAGQVLGGLQGSQAGQALQPPSMEVSNSDLKNLWGDSE